MSSRQWVAADDRHAAAIGAATLLLGNAKGRQRSMDYLAAMLLPAARQGKLEIFVNVDGLPVAYVVWAKLGKQAEQKLLSNLRVMPEEHDLDSGDSLWILDLVAPYGNIKYLLAELRDRNFADAFRVRYLRSKNGRMMAKEIDRSSCTHFFRSRRTLPWSCGKADCSACGPLLSAS